MPDGGLFSHETEEKIGKEIRQQLRRLRGQEVTLLSIQPEELLRKVPFFANIDPHEFPNLCNRMHAHTLDQNEVIIRQGAPGDSLFLIARGVVRVSRQQDGQTHNLASLFSGDFFGEMAFLHRRPRSATIITVTPCAIYELKRSDLEQEISRYPAIRAGLEEADKRRHLESSDINGQIL